MKGNTTDIIYHYCSIDAFLSIIQNSSLWLSDILKSNDNKECTWIRDKINVEIENILSQTDNKALKAWQTWYEMTSDLSAMTVYTSCFSESIDSLSQWRGYAEDGKGLAIGFSKKHFQLLNGKAPFNLLFNKVIYDENKQNRFVKSIANENIEKMQLKGVGHVGLELNVNYLLKFPLYKNPSFKEENEWRIIFLSNPGAKRVSAIWDGFQFLDTKFRVVNGKIVSYLELNFEIIKKEIIKEIWIGPKSKISKSDIKNLLYANDYYTDTPYNYEEPIHIQSSKSSYR